MGVGLIRLEDMEILTKEQNVVDKTLIKIIY